MTPWYHALSSAQKFGGNPFDYIAIHAWFDETKQYTGNWTHRVLRHHAVGIEQACAVFGHVLKVAGREVPVRSVAEQHVIEDCGFIPTIQDWLEPLSRNPESWMLKVQKKSVELLKIDD
jgi:hypothetical protein